MCGLLADTGDLHPFPVDVSVHDGEGSLLIEWSFPESIDPSSIIVSVKESGENQFRKIAELPHGTKSYLDQNCVPDVRYFYQVKIKDYFGNTFSSDSITPIFGSCLPIEDYLIHEQDFKSIEDVILFSIIHENSMEETDSLIHEIFSLFKDESFHQYSWLEQFDLNYINNVSGRLLEIEDLIFDSEFENDIVSKELKFRNLLHITPPDWEKTVKSGLDTFKSNWNIFHNSYDECIAQLDKIEPIRITHLLVNETGESILKLFTFHPEKLRSNEIFLLSGDEFLNVTEIQMNEGRAFSVKIPQNWTYVDLMMGDIFIQTCAILKNKSITYTLDGDLIPMVQSEKFKVTGQKSDLWLNEIAWNAYTKELKIEVAGMSTFDEHYSILLNGEIIWDIELRPSNENQFSDSTFLLSTDINYPQTISFQRNIDEIQTIEYHVLDSIPIAISRIPDGEQWQFSEYTSLGKSNSTDDDLIESNLLPELFVLYQNYPNPFNGQTRITFDLLEDAITSLYITDATGRIHDKFLESEFLTSGNYQFEWDGEGKSTGIYFFTLHAQTGTTVPTIQSRKMIYLK